MTRYTRLETAVMDVLAHDLRHQVPDLAGQFEASRPSLRRNSGFGLFTEMIVDRRRPPPPSGPTGDFGTVHAMVADLPDPIAFKARLRHGVLLGLLGDSYGQDTRAIDFAAAPFDQVFLVDDQGRSIPFEPDRHRPPSPLLDLQKHGDAAVPAAPPPPPRLINVGPLQKLQKTGRDPSFTTGLLPAPNRPYEGLAAFLPGAADPSAPLTREEKTTLRVGLWVALSAVAGILVLAFGASPAPVIVGAVLLGRLLQTKPGLRVLRRAIAELQKHAKTR